MKAILKSATVFLLVCFTIPAEAGNDRKSRPDQDISKSIKKFDKDGDGVLNAEEKKAYNKARHEHFLLSKFDKDGDGKLSEKEKEEIKAFYHKKKMERMDKNGDGVISEEEKAAFAAENAKRKAEWLKRFHKDGDSKVSDEERSNPSKEHAKSEKADPSPKKEKKGEEKIEFNDFVPPPAE